MWPSKGQWLIRMAQLQPTDSETSSRPSRHDSIQATYTINLHMIACLTDKVPYRKAVPEARKILPGGGHLSLHEDGMFQGCTVDLTTLVVQNMPF